MLRKASKLNMSELESADCIGALHTLYSMTLSPVGEFSLYAGCLSVYLLGVLCVFMPS